MINPDEKPPKFYSTNWFMWVTLILFAPVGIACMWKYKKFSTNKTRKIMTAIFSLYFIGIVMYTYSPSHVRDQQALAEVNAAAVAQKKVADDQAAADKKVAADAEQKKADDLKVADAAKMKSDLLYYSQVKAKEVFGDRLVNVEKDALGVRITFKLTDNLNMKMVGDGGFIDSSKMFSMYKGHEADFTNITLRGTFPMQDKFGTKSDDVVFIITLDSDTIQKTTFENLPDLIPLSISHAIRPELLTK